MNSADAAANVDEPPGGGAIARRQPSGRAPPRSGFIAKHWRGDYSLPVAYWLISLLTTLFTYTLATAIASGAVAIGYHPVAIWATAMGLWLGMLIISIWHLVGTWRSATNHSRNPAKRQRWWGTVAQVMLVLAAVSAIGDFSPAIPQLTELTRVAWMGDPSIPAYRLTITEGGRELKVAGGIKAGLTADIMTLLQASPDLRTIDLESPGGRLGVAAELWDLIDRHHLNTVTNGSCESACALVFTAGANRWLGIYGRLGFHSSAMPGLTDQDLRSSQAAIQDRIARRNGTSLAFLRRASSVPANTMWYPDRGQLLHDHILTQNASPARSSLAIAETALRPVADTLKGGLPRKIGTSTTLVDVFVKGNHLTYVYTINPTGTASLPDNFAITMQPKVASSTCANASLKQDIARGVVYGHLYRSERDGGRPAYLEVDRCP